jgi:hydroxyacylglutathione hydrolase
VRNSVTASALRRDGFDVVELDGSYLGWLAVPGNVPVTDETASDTTLAA